MQTTATGICCACFDPIYGEPVQLRQKGRKFHKHCASTDSYYVRLEHKIVSKLRQKGVLKP
ncbi:MAG TPA: hypothetical protein VLH56_14435 [Dissulfurispiraceae bacterium]|nr:hypothetical protein [Dissulfurispiraceae bacterium]